VLTYDKRKNWYESSLDDLPATHSRAAAFLKTQPDVGSVGIWGVSQAGWVIPRALVHALMRFPLQ